MSDNYWSERSKKNLEECHPMLQCLFNEVLKHWDCTILDGYRGEAEQNEAYRKGYSKLKYPHSKHNKKKDGKPYSYAADVKPVNVAWEDMNTLYMFVGFVKGVASCTDYLGLRISDYLRCGADWNRNKDIHDQTFHDLPHFELINVEEIDRLTLG